MHRFTIRFFSLFLLILTFLIITPQTILAEDELYPTIPQQTEELPYLLMEPTVYGLTEAPEICNYLGATYVVLIGIVGIIAVIVVLLAGVQFIAGAANESRRSDAKDKLRNAVIGIIIAITSWALLNTLDPDFVKGCYVLTALSPSTSQVILPPNLTPTITATPESVTIFVGSTYTEADMLIGVTAFDPEDGNITAQIEMLSNTITTAVSGEYYILYIIEDSLGLVAETNRVVLVVDTTAPLLGFAADVITVPSGTTYTDAELLEFVTAHDFTDGDITGDVVIVSNNIDPSTSGTYQVVFSVTDSDGEVTTETLTVIINDPPTIALSTDTITITEGDIYTDADILSLATANDTEDGNITLGVSILSNTVNPYIPGEYTVVYEVTDTNDNTTTAELTVIVEPAPVVIPPEELTPPVLSLLTSTISVPVGFVYTLQDALDHATAMDTQDGDLTSSIVILFDNVDVNVPGEYTITYSVTDSSGLSDTDDLAVTIEEPISEPPVITLSETTLNVAINSTPLSEEELLSYATAFDPEDGDITSDIVLLTYAINYEEEGYYFAIFFVNDSSGVGTNVVLSVVVGTPDPIEPVIEFIEPALYVALNSTLTDEILLTNVVAYDNYDNVISDDIVVLSHDIDINTLGTYTIEYMVTDAEGLIDTKIGTIIVANPPVITLAFSTVEIPIDTPYTAADVLANATASDIEDGDLTSSITYTGEIDFNTAGVYEIVYNVIDSNGLTDTETLSVTITSYDPEITLLFTAVEILTTDIPITVADIIANATAFDIEDGDITPSITYTGVIDHDTAGVYEIVYNVIDSHGLTDTAITTVTVIDCRIDPATYAGYLDTCPAGYAEADGWVCLVDTYPGTDYIMEARFNMNDMCVDRAVIWIPGGGGESHLRAQIPGVAGIQDALGADDIRTIEFSFANSEGILANTLDAGTYFDGPINKSAVIAYYVSAMNTLGLGGGAKFDILGGSFSTIMTVYGMSFHNMDQYVNRAVLQLGPMGFNMKDELNNPLAPSYVGGDPLNIYSGEMLGTQYIRQIFADVNGWSKILPSPFCDPSGPCPAYDQFSLLTTDLMGTTIPTPGASINFSSTIFSLVGAEDIPWITASSQYMESVMLSPYTTIIIPGADHSSQSLEMDAKILELLSY